MAVKLGTADSPGDALYRLIPTSNAGAIHNVDTWYTVLSPARGEDYLKYLPK